MPPQTTAAMLAARKAARKAAQAGPRPDASGPMFSSIGQDAPRQHGSSRVVLAIAAVGIGVASLSLAAQLFGWGRPTPPVRVHMMADEADAAARAMDTPPPSVEPR